MFVFFTSVNLPSCPKFLGTSTKVIQKGVKNIKKCMVNLIDY